MLAGVFSVAFLHCLLLVVSKRVHCVFEEILAFYFHFIESVSGDFAEPCFMMEAFLGICILISTSFAKCFINGVAIPIMFLNTIGTRMCSPLYRRKAPPVTLQQCHYENMPIQIY